MVELDNGRLQAITQNGNVFGYVGKHHVEAAGRQRAWKVAWATAVDGNVNAILLPVGETCNELV